MPVRSRSTKFLSGVLVLLATVAAIPAPAAGDEGPPPRRQPGSWSSRIEVTNVTGKDADAIKARMNGGFAKLLDMSYCVTPDLAAAEDPTNAVANNLGECTYSEKDVTGPTIGLSGTCRSGGLRTRITIRGTVGPTMQDYTISLSGTDADGPHTIDMTVHSWRNGECTDKDLKAPAPPTI